MKKLLIFSLLLCAGTLRAQNTTTNGGTGLIGLSPWGILTGGAGGQNPVVQVPTGTSGQILASGGSSAAPSWETLVPIANGGTGFASSGKVLNADTATTGQALIGSPLQFTTTANQRYAISGNIIATSSAATGLKLGLRIPSGDTCYVTFNGTDTTTLQSNVSAVTADSGLTAVYGQLNGTCYIHYEGIVSGPTAGAVIVGFLKGTSGTATLKQWSYLMWRRIY